MKILIFTLLSVLAILFSPMANAGNVGTLIADGQILRADGTPLEQTGVSFRAILKNPAGTCVLWDETFTNVDMTGSNGFFTLNLGAGTKNGGVATFPQVFVNGGTVTGAAACSYTPAATDDRILVLSFSTDSWTTTNSLSAQTIKSVPYAMQANQIGGFDITGLARISTAGGSAISLTKNGYEFLANLSAPATANSTPCTTGQVLSYNGTSWVCASGSAGTVTSVAGSTRIAVTNGTGPAVSLDLATSGVSAGTYGSATQVPVVVVDTYGRVTNVSNTAITFPAVQTWAQTAPGPTLLTTGGSLGVNVGVGANQIIQMTAATKLPAVDGSLLTNINDSTKLPLAGGTMTGAINMGGFDITAGGNILLSASKNLGLGQYAADPSTAGWNATQKGYTWFNTTSNQIKFWDGSTIQILGVAGAGLNSLNGQSGTSQSFGTTSTGTDFTITSATNVHTFNLPSSSATARGLLTSADWSTFNGKMGSALSATQIYVGNGSNVATSVPMTGDGTLTVSGALVLKNTGTVGTYTKVTTDAQGRVSSGTSPTTLAGYGITDAFPTAGTLAIANGGTGATTAAAALTALLPTQTGNAGYTLMTNGTSASWGTMTSNQWTTSGSTIYYGTSANKVGVGTSTPRSTLEVAGGIQIADDVAACAAGKVGTIKYAGGILQFCDGTTWQSLGVAGAGLTNLNGQSGTSQSFGTTVTGTDFTITSTANVHTFNLPSSSATARGLLTSADWSTFNGKIGSALNATQIFVGNGSNVATSVPMTGDGTLTVSGALVLKNTGTAGSYTKVTTDAQGRIISGTGTLAIADGGTGLSTAPAAGQLLIGNAGGTAYSLGTLFGDGILASTGSLTLSSSIFRNGGNSLGTAGTLGNSANGRLAIITNNIVRATMTANGSLGIGTITPSDKLTLFVPTTAAMQANGITIATDSAVTSQATLSLLTNATAAAAPWGIGGSAGQGWQLYANGVNYPAAANAINNDFGIAYYDGGAIKNPFYIQATSGNVGIGNTTPGSTLDVKGTLRLSGATSGYVGFAPAAAAGAITYTLPSADGTSGQFLKTNGAATLSWATASGGGGITNLIAGTGLSGGTITSTGSIAVNVGTSANQIVQLNGSSQLPAVDGSLLMGLTASQISGIVPIANGGTNSNTALNSNRIMVSSAGKIVEMAVAMTNGQIIVGSTAAAPVVTTLGSSGGITTTAGAGTLSIGSNGTNANTNNALVMRDGSGNFSAGAVTNLQNVLQGSTSGLLTLLPPASFTTYSLTFPSNAGTSGQVLSTNGAGVMSWVAPSPGTVTSVSSGTGLLGGPVTGAGTLSIDVGTGASQIVQLDGSGRLPAVDGSNVVNVKTANLDTSSTSVSGTVSFNFATSTTIIASALSGAAVTVSGMRDGGTYKLVITDTTSRTYTFGGGGQCTTSKFNPANSPTGAGTSSIYAILYAGGICYINWSTGY